jgi:hypothetical protein
MRSPGLLAVARVACLSAFGLTTAAAGGDSAGYDPASSVGDPSTGFNCGYSVASGGAGGPRNSAIDSYANLGFGVCVAQMSGVTLTKEIVAGRRAVVASKRVAGPITESTRIMFRRAGYTQFGQTYFCRDSHYLLQSPERLCFNLLPAQ